MPSSVLVHPSAIWTEISLKFGPAQPLNVSFIFSYFIIPSCHISELPICQDKLFGNKVGQENVNERLVDNPILGVWGADISDIVSYLMVTKQFWYFLQTYLFKMSVISNHVHKTLEIFFISFRNLTRTWAQLVYYCLFK